MTTLGPVELPTAAPPDAVSARLSVAHFENASCAVAVPALTVTLNVREGFFALSDPLNVCVCMLGGEGAGGGGAGAEATTAVGGDGALADPAEFDAVTTATSVEPTSADPAPYDDEVAPAIAAQFAPVESQRFH